MAFRIKDGVRVGTVDVFNNSGTLLVNAPGWITSRTITLGGDLSGSVSLNGTSDVTLTATIAANSVALGTDTTGNYMVNVTGSSGVAITHTQGEGSTAAAALTGQALALHNLATSGIIARTGTDTVAGRTLTAGTAISISNGDGVSGNPTITNTGVTSAVAGTGISVSGATGAVTITNSGVTSAVAGTDITVSGATGAVTIATNSTLATVTGRGATTATALSLTNSTASSNTTTGALVVTGGVGIGGALNVGGAAAVTGNLTISGNLIVNGTTQTTNSTVVTIDDPVFTLGGDTAPTSDDNKDRGIEFRWHNGTAAKLGFFGFDDSTGKLTFIPDATNTSEVFSGAVGEIDATIAWSNVTGDTTVGSNLVTLANPSAVTFLRINADNTVSALNATNFRTAIGAGTGSGTVTSVATGTGLTGGTITGSGTISLTGQALAFHNLASNGIVARTAANTVAARTITAGTAISVTNGDGVGGNPTITNTGVTSAVAGTGISVSGATGAVTVTNTGVTSIVAGNAITISGSTGAVTVNHSDTSSVGNISSDNSGNTFIQDISFTFDTYGHVTAATVATGTVTGFLTAESDTLQSVTGRGNTSTNNIQINNAELVLAPSTTARIFRRAVQPAAIATNSATAVDSWATATYRSAEYTIQVVQGTKYQISKMVMIHDGTSVYLTEYAVNENSSIPVTFTAAIATGTLTLNATITDAATTNATVTLERKLFAV